MIIIPLHDKHKKDKNTANGEFVMITICYFHIITCFCRLTYFPYKLKKSYSLLIEVSNQFIIKDVMIEKSTKRTTNLVSSI
jgi:hypothetical protein